MVLEKEMESIMTIILGLHIMESGIMTQKMGKVTWVLLVWIMFMMDNLKMGWKVGKGNSLLLKRSIQVGGEMTNTTNLESW